MLRSVIPAFNKIAIPIFSLVFLLSLSLLLFDSAPVSGVGDPVVAAAGDIACDPTRGSAASCSSMDTSNLLIKINPTAVLPLGDNQYEAGALSDFMKIYDPTWGRLKSITHPAVGNHEYLTSNAAGYFSYFGSAAGDPRKGYYSYDLGAWHLIALNSNCSEAGGCTPGSPEVNWLKSDLAAHKSQCIVAYMHHPYYSSGMFGFESKYATFWQTLYNGHADILLSGHDHDYERFALQNASAKIDPKGVRQFVVGTGGSNHTSMSTLAQNSQVYNDTTFGVLKLTLHVGSYDWQFVPVAGSSFTDSGTQTCHNLALPASTSIPTLAKSTATPRITATPSLTAAPGPTATPRVPSGAPPVYLPFIRR